MSRRTVVWITAAVAGTLLLVWAARSLDLLTVFRRLHGM